MPEQLTDEQIKSYLENPDTLPDDADTLLALAGTPGLLPQDGSEKTAAETLNGDISDDSTGKSDPTTAAPAKKDEPSKEEPPASAPPASQDQSLDPNAIDAANTVIKTRDGKHEMPFSVLQSAREREAQARREAEELRNQLEAERTEKAELQQRIEAANKAGGIRQGDQVDADDATNPNVAFDEAAFRENYGDELTEFVKAQREQTARLERELSELRARDQQAVQEQQKSVQAQIQEAIDNNPTLTAWRESDPTMWAAAIAVDNQLKDDPAWKGKPYAERFNAVVEKLTGKRASSAGSNEQDLDKKAEEALAKAKTTVPTSLSDIPGGREPGQSERDNVEDMSVAALGSKFENMTPEQRDAYLASL